MMETKQINGLTLSSNLSQPMFLKVNIKLKKNLLF